MRPLPIVRPARHGVFTASEALASGWTREALRQAVQRERLIRVHRGVFAPVNTPAAATDSRSRDLVIASVAATLAVRGSVASHASAAVLAQLPLWSTPSRGCVTVRPKYTGDSIAAHLHRATLPPGHVTTSAVPRTSATRTVLDIAREHGLEDAVVAGDAALARGMTDPVRLASAAEYCARWPGARHLSTVVAELDARSESPLESVSRLRLVLARVPRPEPQVEIVDERGFLLGRVDLYWDEFGVAGEVDGRVKYAEDPRGAVLREKQRQELLEDTNLVVVRWGSSDLANLPRLVDRLAVAFARGARRPRADRRWTPVSTDDRVAPRVVAS